MKIVIILKIVAILYKVGFREILINFINDPNNTWDDELIKALDEFLNYSEIKRN